MAEFYCPTCKEVISSTSILGSEPTKCSKCGGQLHEVTDVTNGKGNVQQPDHQDEFILGFSFGQIVPLYLCLCSRALWQSMVSLFVIFIMIIALFALFGYVGDSKPESRVFPTTIGLLTYLAFFLSTGSQSRALRWKKLNWSSFDELKRMKRLGPT